MTVNPAGSNALVFISYARTDSEFAYRLRADLEASGFSTWIDTAKLGTEGGQEWLRIIQDAVDSCQAMVVVVSPISVQSRYVHMEYHRAQRQGKLVIPLHYQTVTNAPIDLELDQWVEFRADQDHDGWYQMGLSNTIRSLGKAPKPLQSSELLPMIAQEPLTISEGADIPAFGPVPPAPQAVAHAIQDLTVAIYSARAAGNLTSEEHFLRQVVDSGDPHLSLEFGERLEVVVREIKQQRTLRLNQLAEEAMQLKQWRRAIGAWQALLDLEPDNVDAKIGLQRARRARAEEALQAGEYDEAVGTWQVLARFDLSLTTGSGLRRALRARAKDAWRRADWARAIESWNALHLLKPPEEAANEYLVAITENRNQDYRYQAAQRLVQVNDEAGARSALIDLYHAAPHYGDPYGIAKKLGIDVSEEPEALEKSIQQGKQLPVTNAAVRHNLKRTHVLSFTNQKGRTGKTTSAINLGDFLAKAGYSTLVVDISPSAEATTGLGVDSHSVGNSIYEMLVNQSVKPADVIRREIRPNLALLPATSDLYAADIELVYLDNREYRLRHILDQVRDNYDFVLIDCPSALDLLTINALTASDGVILPLRCEYFALEGMQQLLNTIRLVRDRLNNSVSLFGVVLTRYNPHNKLANEIVDEISQHFPREKFDTLIPRDVRLSEAPSYGKTILEHDPRSPGALAYKALAEEVIARAATMESLHA